MSRAKFDASQPSPKPKGVDPASKPPIVPSAAGKLAAVVGVAAPLDSAEIGPSGGAPRTSTMGPLDEVRGVHAPPQMTPSERASCRDISTSRASMWIEGAGRSTLSMNSLILPRFSGTSRTINELVRWSMVRRAPGGEHAGGLAFLLLDPAGDRVLDPPLFLRGDDVREEVDGRDGLDPDMPVLELEDFLGQRGEQLLELARLTSNSCRASADARSCSASRMSLPCAAARSRPHAARPGRTLRPPS